MTTFFYVTDTGKLYCATCNAELDKETIERDGCTERRWSCPNGHGDALMLHLDMGELDLSDVRDAVVPT